MAKKKRPVHFEIPRDEDGHFLPKEMWTKKEIREHDRLKREGLLANPMRKTKIKGTKKPKDLYVQPQKGGTFLPKEKWSKSERRLAKRAQEEGLTIAAQLPRDDKGRFVSPTGRKRKKKKKNNQQQMVPAEYQAMISQRPGDVAGMHQGNVTVVYPPYPPYAPTAPAVMQMPQQQALSKRDIQMLIEGVSGEDGVEGGHLCSDCEHDIIEAVNVLQEDNKRLVKELQRRNVIPQFEEEERLQIEDIGSPKQLELGFPEEALKKNPRSRYPMYYVKPTFGERLGSVLGNLGKRPFLALIAIGAIAAIGYALYRAIKAFQYRALASVGVEIVGGTIYFPGENPYVITDDDKLWLARSIWGEVSRDPAAWTRSDVQHGGSAVLWAFANHYITVGNKRNLYQTLGDFVQAYSQPINPRWDSASDTRCLESPEMCTPDRLAFRNSLRAMPWTSFPPALQNLVISFAAGQVPNPVGTRTDFRAAGTGYTPADPINVAGNVFGTASNARRRPVEQVA